MYRPVPEDDDDMAGPLPLHRRQRRMDRVEQPEEVDLDHLLILGGGRVPERRGNADAGDAEQHVEPAEIADRPLHHRRSLCLVGHVGLDR